MKHVFVITMLAGALLWSGVFLCSCTGGQRQIPITPSQEGDVVFLTSDADAPPEMLPGDDDPAVGPPTLQRETVTASVMQVNSTFITVDDVLQRKRAELQALPSTLDEASFRQQAQTIVRDGVYELVRQALVYETANNRLSDEEKEQITTELRQARQDMINRAGGSLGKLHEQLAADGLTLDGVLAEHRKKLVIDLYIRWKMQPSIYVSRKMLWEYYQSHASEFTSPRRVAMQLIVVDARKVAAAGGDTSDAGLDKARATARTRIGAAQVRLRAGAAFEDVARMYSTDARAADGGRWPLMRQGSHQLAKVEQAAFELEPGQISEIVEDGDSFAIVRAAEVDPGGKTPFETAQRDIEKNLRDEQFRVLQERHHQDLVKTAYIQQNDDFFDRCARHAMEKYWRKP